MSQATQVAESETQQTTQSFSELLTQYIQLRSNYSGPSTIDFESLAHAVDTPGVGAERLRAIAAGNSFASMHVTARLADVLNINDRATPMNSASKASTPRTDFIASSYAMMSKQPLMKLIDDYAAQKGFMQNIDVIRSLGLTKSKFGVVKRNGAFSSRKDALSFAIAYDIPAQYQEDFLERFGGFYLRKDKVILDLKEKKISVAKAIGALCEISGFMHQDVFSRLGVNQGTFASWASEVIQNIPPRNHMLSMAGEDLFDLSDEQKKIFLEAADHYVEAPDVVAALRTGKITVQRAVRGLMELNAGSSADYAKKIDVKLGTVKTWYENIQRTRLLPLIKDLTLDDQRFMMEQTSHYLNPKHLKAKMLEKPYTPEMFYAALKDIYDLTDDDFGIDESTIRHHRAKDFKPSIQSRVTQFTAVEKNHGELEICWETYKEICSRHAGHNDGSQTSTLFKKQMDEERQQKIKQR